MKLATDRIIGLLANPLSGKDIRRIVAQASIFPNHEKVNILRRVLLGLAAIGIDRVLAMPDPTSLINRASQGLQLPFEVEELALRCQGTAEDTTRAATLMRQAGARCLVTLGGDGTCRAAARGAGSVPLLPLSTGTNNAFPRFIEGTLAGMAAASVASCSRPQVLTRVPALELLCDGTCVDLALVDVAAVNAGLGARAIWELEQVSLVVTTQLHPGTIGLSALGGAVGFEAPSWAHAVALTLGSSGREILAPIAPGIVRQLPVRDLRWLGNGDSIDLPTSCALALDGEREHLIRSQHWSVRLVADGPFIVSVEQALQALYS